MKPEADDWLHALTGRAVAKQDSPEAKQGAAIRKYFKRRQDEDEALDRTEATQRDAEREKRMLNYLRAKGAFQEAAPEPGAMEALLARIRAFFSFSTPGVSSRMAMAAVVVLSLVLIPLLSNRPDPGSDGSVVYRGGPGEIVIADAQPQAQAESLLAQLKENGVAARIVVKQQPAAWVVEAKVEEAQLDSVTPLLKARGIAFPKKGILIVAYRAP